ncbi:transmembrane protein 114-like [Tubulanus polymorphus]|uniref:transmembrane protein 114-like n=1 Tax=Tubulanus polymorphus TaxID=672921 RepID=UPI003DA5649C
MRASCRKLIQQTNENMASLSSIEKRLLKGFMVATVVAFFVMIISVATDYWLILDLKTGFYRNASDSFLLKSYSGLWRICRIEVTNHSRGFRKHERCSPLKFYPSYKEVENNPEIDYGILNYSRTVTAFAIMSLVLMIMGCGFALYTFWEPRYMFKRLAAFLHIMSAVCVLVCIEVLMTSMEYTAEHLPARFPKTAYLHYGFSFGFAWIVFLVYLSAGAVFLFASRKRKGENAPSETVAEANEPLHLGRV